MGCQSMTTWKNLALALLALQRRCDLCDQPATRAWRQGGPGFCDRHATTGHVDLPQAPTVRAVLTKGRMR